MNILLLRGFNNYFNRVVKKYSTLIDYKNNSASYLDLSNINFNPNDGVVTELIIGSTDQQENNTPLKWDEIGTPDYCICYEMEGNPAAAVIKFRWFVLESERTRNGQYRIALKRDVIAENFDKVMAAPCFVEKGIISNNSDPLLFNSENMSFNQIKQNETLLKDKTGCAWIIGYVSQDKQRYPSSGYYQSTSPVATYENYSDVPQELKNLAAMSYFQRPVARINTSWGVPAGRCRMTIYWRMNDAPAFQEVKFNNIANWADEVSYGSPSIMPPLGYGYLRGVSSSAEVSNLSFSSTTVAGKGAADLMQMIRYNTTLRAQYVNNVLTNGVDFDQETQDLIETWNGRYFKNGNKMYQIVYEETQGRTMGPDWTIAGGTQFDAIVRGCITTITGDSDYNGVAFFEDGNSAVPTDNIGVVGASSGYQLCKLSWEYYQARVSFVEITADAGDTINTYIPADRLQACDTPMDIFAIPFDDNFKIYTGVDGEGDPDPTTLITLSKQTALQAAVSLAQAGSNVYDIQILPYFPNPDMEEYIQNKQIVIPDTPFTENIHYNYFHNTANAPIGIIFWSRTSTFTVDIDQEISLPNTDALTLKKSNNTDLFRLTSPNYAGSFEFSLAKSGGRVTKFNADCTYKPYNPYIHVTPDLAGLYGQNFSTIDDARGLICGGDFSITKIVDQWQQYELQNKNYQNIFDRQIQNLDIGQQIQREQAEWKGITGIVGSVIGGGVSGALAGAKAGPYGAIAGAVGGATIGTAFSAIGYLKDKDWLNRAQAETKDYTIDLYGYQLGNVKALPNALSRTAAQTNNNKIFPFVEYFTATDAEKDMFEAKIEYNGMTIMKISTLNNYSSSSDFDKVYVKGQMIRLDNLNDDFHVADAIYQEVNKGFYIPQ